MDFDFQNIGTPPKNDAPYSLWKKSDVAIVESVIILAWSAMASDPSKSIVLTTGTEVEITHALIEVMEMLLNSKQIPSFNPRKFCAPHRGAELENVSGDRLEMRPDLAVSLMSARPASALNALFFECKRLSPAHSIGNYVQDGVMRFCEQSYAWATVHAGMLAYVQNLTPVPKAKDMLENYWLANPRDFTVPVSDPKVDSATDVAVTVTEHQRILPLPNGKLSPNIELRHIWLAS